MKILKTIAVLILVVGLPAGSWLFLQHGLDWRIVKAEQLQPKSKLLDDYSWTGAQRADAENFFAGSTTLLINGEVGESETVIIDQFKDAFTFTAKTTTQLPSSIKSKLTEGGMKYMLVDTGLVVRQIYVDSNLATIHRLIEDIALITPQPKTRDIKLRDRDEN